MPVEDRPWRVLLVPPTPGAQTRAFHLARWQTRLVVAVAIALTVLAGGAVAALVVALRSPDVFGSSLEAVGLRHRLTAVEDSLALARALFVELGKPKNPEPAFDPMAPIEALRGSSGRRRPLLARGTGARVSTDSALRVGGIDGLPTTGVIGSEFSSARRHPLLHIIRPHLGIDISAPRGTLISAPAAGRVTFVGRKFALGLVVEIDHSNGIITRYAHCRTTSVREGDRVTRGTPIGTVGSSGLTTGPHLHYEVWANGRPVDPLRFKVPQVGDSVSASPAIPASDVASPPARNDASPVPEAPTPR